MICKAAAFLVKHGPASQQDRWEALSGYAVFTMACEIPALLAAADFADDAGQGSIAEFLRCTADAWNDAVDTLLYATGTSLAKKHDVPGYYVRIMPDKAITEPDANSLWIHLENHVIGGHHHAVNVVSPDALALTRYGLRSADDPRMQATAKVLDAELRKELSTGPGWIRSTDDGVWRTRPMARPTTATASAAAWPLLAGERGHFELASGNKEAAAELLRVISRQTSECGMVPEQVWDAEDIPRTPAVQWPPRGFRHAAGLGPRGVCQAGALDARR